MSYGLYDGDLILYPKVPFFNLELMKLSTYYKSKREIVSMAPTFTPQRYSNFIVRQDYFSQQTYPLHYKNVIYGGRAFEGQKYHPLAIEIEKCKPDIDLYSRIQPKSNFTTGDKMNLSVMRNADHLRLSLDEETIWKDFEKQIPNRTHKSGFIFHDYNLGQIKDAPEVIRDLLNYYVKAPKNRRIGMKFPTQVNNEKDLITWLSFLNTGAHYYIQYNGLINESYVEEIADLCRGTSKAIQTSMNVTYNTTYSKFITQDITKILPLVSNLRSHKCGFLLIYDSPFFADRRWIPVMDLLQRYCYHISSNVTESDYYKRVSPYETLYHYTKNLTEQYGAARLPKQKAQEIYQFVREQNYELFTQFYECS